MFSAVTSPSKTNFFGFPPLDGTTILIAGVFRFLNTDIFSESWTKTAVLDVGDGSLDFSLELVGNFFEEGFSSVSSFVLLVDQEESWDVVTKDLLSGFLVERKDGWGSVFVNEFLQAFAIDGSSQFVSTFIELLKEQDVGSFRDVLFSSEFSGSCVNKPDVVVSLAGTIESSVACVILSSEEDDQDLVFADCGSKLFRIANF